MDRRRVAFHEAGHLVMAFLLQMEVLSCDLGRREDAPDELGRCVVVTPDPVGIRRFLLAMGGVMAEDRFFKDEQGGLKDRRDAVEALENYLAHYRRRDRDNAESVLHLASELFHSPASLRVIRRGAALLARSRSLDGPQIHLLRQELLSEIDPTPLTAAVDGLAEPQEPLGLRGMAVEAFHLLKRLVLSLRKPF